MSRVRVGQLLADGTLVECQDLFSLVDKNLGIRDAVRHLYHIGTFVVWLDFGGS